MWGDQEGNESGGVGSPSLDLNFNHTSGSPGELVKIQVPRPSPEVNIQQGGVRLGISILMDCPAQKEAVQGQDLEYHSKIQVQGLESSAVDHSFKAIRF